MAEVDLKAVWRELGEIRTDLRHLVGAIESHKTETRAGFQLASDARKSMYQAQEQHRVEMTEVKRDVKAMADAVAIYGPEIDRWKTYRRAGLFGGSLCVTVVTVGIAIITFWEKIKALFASVRGG